MKPPKIEKQTKKFTTGKITVKGNKVIYTSPKYGIVSVELGR